MFGKIHYDLQNGTTLMTVSCADAGEYERELLDACRWAESEPGALGVRGERFHVAHLEAKA